MRNATEGKKAFGRRNAPLYEPLDGFLIRMPALSIEFYKELCEDLKFPGRIAKKHLRNRFIRNALALSSIEFFDALEKAIGTKQMNEKAIAKLAYYLIRMSTRPTPYGLFSGVALGRWSNETNLRFKKKSIYFEARADMGWLLPLVSRIESNTHAEKGFSVMANQTLQQCGDRIFMLESLPLSDLKAQQIISIRATNAIKDMLALAKEGIPFEELVRTLSNKYHVGEEKIKKVVHDLLSQTILISDFRPPITGMDPLEYVIKHCNGGCEINEQLKYIKKQLELFNVTPASKIEGTYRKISKEVNKLAGSDYNNPIQVDFAFILKNASLAREVGEEAARAAELLLSISPFPKGQRNLDGYKNRFREKYGEWREVPLIELCSPDLGLGTPYGKESRIVDASIPENQARDEMLASLATASLHGRQLAINLDEIALAKLKTCEPSHYTAPSSLDLFISVITGDEVHSGNFKVLVSSAVGAMAAGDAMNRFCHLLGPASSRLFDSMKEAETQNTDCLIVEAVGMPKKVRSLNAAIRKPLCEYEIALGLSPGVSRDKTIRLDELVVGLERDRLYIRWVKDDKRVKVHSSCMLTESFLPTSLRLLLDISRDGVPMLYHFDWGSAENLPFLPRVESGRTILRAAQWKLKQGIGTENLLDTTTKENFLGSLKKWRAEWQAPKYVNLLHRDTSLLLNLESAEQAEFLRQELKKSSGRNLVLEECMFPNNAIVQIAGEHYVSEFVVPLKLRKLDKKRIERNSDQKGSFIKPTYLPVEQGFRFKPSSTDWLFSKIYVAEELEEAFIADKLYEFSTACVKQGLASEWFFVRYKDPKSHIRLRFKGEPERLAGTLLPELCRWLANLTERRECLDFSINTYEREVERYGGKEGILLAENVFAIDSKIVAEVLRARNGPSRPMDKIVIAAFTADFLLASLKVPFEDRAKMYYDWAEGTMQPYKDKFKEMLDALCSSIEDPAKFEISIGGSEMATSFGKEKECLEKVGEEITRVISQEKLCQPLGTICNSYVHMHCNRLLGTDKKEEGAVLVLLKRAYEQLSHKYNKDNNFDITHSGV